MLGRLAAVAASCALLACSKSDGSSPPPVQDAGPVDMSPPAWNRTVTPPSDSTAQTQRAACGYMAGALPAETQGSGSPDGTTIPIDTIVVVMMENRSFDHYFQDLPNSGQPGADVAPSGASNLGIDGTAVPFQHDTQFCFADTNHEWAGTHQEINNGKMDGFAVANDGTHESPMVGPPGFLSGSRAMVYYTAQDLPFMYWAAQNFAIGDRYFASLPGPTWPNRMYMYAASSFGLTDNTFPPAETTLFDYLNTRGVTWGVYANGTPGFGIFLPQLLANRANVHTLAQFATDAAAGKLPHVVFVDPTFGQESYDGNDEHPPAVMQVGQSWLAGVVSNLIASPQWPHTAMFLNYDEHGGLYDHVPPPKACPPDGIQPMTDAGPPDGGSYGGFDQYGVRVPFVVFSPYAKHNYVSHDVYDHTSVVRFIEARFKIPALSNRDANALAPWDMFDFTSTPNLHPPTMPAVPVNQSLITSCGQVFNSVGPPWGN